jgi:tellurite resistance protein
MFVKRITTMTLARHATLANASNRRCAVLKRPPMTDPLSDEAGCIRRVLVAMMVADGDVDPEELATIRSVYASMTGEHVEVDVLIDEAKRMQAEGMTLSTSLHGLEHALGTDGKKKVLVAAFAVATADGFVLDEEDELLAAVGRAIGMDEAEYREALHDLMTGRALL